jgi:3-hydroxyacyl-[acyl-carrier-protein] dehydratase
VLDQESSSTGKNPLEKDLYHREPYLLIDDVLECDSQHIVVVKKLTGHEFFFTGHFPNAPILPGALMQEMTGQAAGVLIARFYNPMGDSYDTSNFDPDRPALGVLSRIKDAKFKDFVRPQDELRITIKMVEKLESAFEFKGTIEKKTDDGFITVMKNHFLLTNIPSRKLLSH